MEEILDTKSRSFQRRGWNGNGSRMLAMACWVSAREGGIVKQNFVDRDSFVVFILVSLAINFISSLVLVLIIAALATSFLVRKLVSKHPVEHILEELHKDSQKILVLKLMDLCEVNHIDPENIKDICQNLEKKLYCDKIYEIISTFINVDTKYYVS